MTRTCPLAVRFAFLGSLVLSGCTSAPVVPSPAVPAETSTNLSAQDYAALGDLAAANGDRDKALAMYEEAIRREKDAMARVELYSRCVVLFRPAAAAAGSAARPAVAPATTQALVPPPVASEPEAVAAGTAPTPAAAPASATSGGAVPFTAAETLAVEAERAFSNQRYGEAVALFVQAAGSTEDPAVCATYLHKADLTYVTNRNMMDPGTRDQVARVLLDGLERGTALGATGTVEPRVRLLLASGQAEAAQATAQAVLRDFAPELHTEGRKALLAVWQADESLPQRRQAWEAALAAGRLSAEDAAYLVEVYTELDFQPEKAAEVCKLRLHWLSSDARALDWLVDRMAGFGQGQEAAALCLGALERTYEAADRDRIAQRWAGLWASQGEDALNAQMNGLVARMEESGGDLDAQVLVEALLSGPMGQPERAASVRASREAAETEHAAAILETSRRYSVLLDSYLGAGRRDEALRLAHEIRSGRYPRTLQEKAAGVAAEVLRAGGPK